MNNFIICHGLRLSGVSLATVQLWMGHSSIETTIKHYGHLVKSFRKEEIRKIEGRMDTCMDTLLKPTLKKARNLLKDLVPPARFELAAPGLGNLCSILLS